MGIAGKGRLAAGPGGPSPRNQNRAPAESSLMAVSPAFEGSHFVGFVWRFSPTADFGPNRRHTARDPLVERSFLPKSTASLLHRVLVHSVQRGVRPGNHTRSLHCDLGRSDDRRRPILQVKVARGCGDAANVVVGQNSGKTTSETSSMVRERNLRWGLGTGSQRHGLSLPE